MLEVYGKGKIIEDSVCSDEKVFWDVQLSRELLVKRIVISVEVYPLPNLTLSFVEIQIPLDPILWVIGFIWHERGQQPKLIFTDFRDLLYYIECWLNREKTAIKDATEALKKLEKMVWKVYWDIINNQMKELDK